MISYPLFLLVNAFPASSNLWLGTYFLLEFSDIIHIVYCDSDRRRFMTDLAVRFLSSAATVTGSNPQGQETQDTESAPEVLLTTA